MIRGRRAGARPVAATVTAAALLALSAPACGRAPRLAPVPAVGACRLPAESAASTLAPVTWIAPADPDDRRRHDRWCAAVGRPLLRATPASPTPAGAIGGVVAVSWNTHVGGGDLLALVRDVRAGRLTDGRVPGTIVLLLQEVFRAGPAVPSHAADPELSGSSIREQPPDAPRIDIAAAAEALGFAVFYAPSMRNGAEPGVAAEDRGNAILSSAPLESPVAIELPFGRQRRVAVAAALAVASHGARTTVRVSSAHLESRWPGVRATQADALATQLAGDAPTVLGADLNTWLGGIEAAYWRLRRRFPDSPPLDATVTFARPSLQLDHFFARLPAGWTARAHRAPHTYHSDHYPIVVELFHPSLQVRTGQ